MKVAGSCDPYSEFAPIFCRLHPCVNFLWYPSVLFDSLGLFFEPLVLLVWVDVSFVHVPSGERNNTTWTYHQLVQQLSVTLVICFIHRWEGDRVLFDTKFFFVLKFLCRWVEVDGHREDGWLTERFPIRACMSLEFLFSQGEHMRPPTPIMRTLCQHFVFVFLSKRIQHPLLPPPPLITGLPFDSLKLFLARGLRRELCSVVFGCFWGHWSMFTKWIM